MDILAAVLWDMDGVLVDTSAFHYQAWSEIMAENRIPFSWAQFRKTFGMNNRDMLTAILDRTPEPGLLAQLSEEKERRFRRAVRSRVRLCPGVEEWLVRLRAKGVKQAVASSAPKPNIDLLLDELGIRPYFGAVLSGADLPGKPDPTLFLTAARRLEEPPRRCLVFEDAVAGVEAASHAGMRCIAVTTTHPASALNGADLIVDGLDRLGMADVTGLFKDGGL
jgi:beta-phosphoglucomutase